jgi:hypothetical protein
MSELLPTKTEHVRRNQTQRESQREIQTEAQWTAKKISRRAKVRAQTKRPEKKSPEQKQAEGKFRRHYGRKLRGTEGKDRPRDGGAIDISSPFAGR